MLFGKIFRNFRDDVFRRRRVLHRLPNLLKDAFNTDLLHEKLHHVASFREVNLTPRCLRFGIDADVVGL